jgi:hypothetical protein
MPRVTGVPFNQTPDKKSIFLFYLRPDSCRIAACVYSARP